MVASILVLDSVSVVVSAPVSVTVPVAVCGGFVCSSSWEMCAQPVVGSASCNLTLATLGKQDSESSCHVPLCWRVHNRQRVDCGGLVSCYLVTFA